MSVILLFFNIAYLSPSSNFDTAVSVGFEMVQYSLSETIGTPPLVVRIVREDSLTSIRGFSINVVVDGSSDASQGK